MSRTLSAATRRHAARVIVFAALSLGALAGSFAYLGSFGVGPKRIFYADFSYAGGLEIGAPIKVSGIKVGQVARLHLLTPDAAPEAAAPTSGRGQRTEPVIRATLYIREAMSSFVTVQSTFSVVTTGIIGDAYLELSPKPGAQALAGSAMRGVDAPHLHHMALASESVLQHLAPLFETEPAADDLGATSPAAAPVARLVQAVAHLLTAHEHDFDAMLGDGAQAAHDMRHIAYALRHALGDGAQLGQSITSVRSLTQALERDYPQMHQEVLAWLGHIEALTTRLDSQMSAQQMHAWFEDLGTTLSRAAAMSKSAQSIVEALAQGEGSLGGALRDPTLYDDLRALMHDLREHPYKLLWRK